MTQKKFMLGLIENELNRDLTQRAEVTETPQEVEESAERNSDSISEEQDSYDISEDIDGDETEYMGMGMSM